MQTLRVSAPGALGPPPAPPPVDSITDDLSSDSGKWSNVAGLYDSGNHAVVFFYDSSKLKAVHGGVSGDRSSGYLNTQELSSANHTVQVTRASTTDLRNTMIGVVARCSANDSVANCVWGAFDDYGPGDSQTWLQKNVGGVATVMVNTWWYSSAPSVIKVVASGTTATLYFDATNIGNGSISGLTGTYCGIASMLQQECESTAQNFSAVVAA